MILPPCAVWLLPPTMGVTLIIRYNILRMYIILAHKSGSLLLFTIHTQMLYCCAFTIYRVVFY